jgi:hypothetical protein
LIIVGNNVASSDLHERVGLTAEVVKCCVVTDLRNHETSVLAFTVLSRTLGELLCKLPYFRALKNKYDYGES